MQKRITFDVAQLIPGLVALSWSESRLRGLDPIAPLVAATGYRCLIAL